MLSGIIQLINMHDNISEISGMKSRLAQATLNTVRKILPAQEFLWNFSLFFS